MVGAPGPGGHHPLQVIVGSGIRLIGHGGRTPTPDGALGTQPGRAHHDEQDDVEQQLEK
jgi:hypothetical protein